MHAASWSVRRSICPRQPDSVDGGMYVFCHTWAKKTSSSLEGPALSSTARKIGISRNS
jgi:hypothetical protein